MSSDRPTDVNMSTDPGKGFAESVFRQYTTLLHRYLARRLSRPQDVDDLAQEVFIRLARLSKPELVQKPRAYLCSIASNLVREFRLRAAREQDQLIFDSEILDDAAEQPSQAPPEDLAERLDLQRQLQRALERLPPVQCAVLLMAKRDGLSHKEIARKTGI